MSVALTITPDAAFPDRPRGGAGRGLLVTAATGDDGAYLSHDLGAALPRLHTRVLLRPVGLIGGATVFLQGLDAAGEPTFTVEYDAASHQVTARVGVVAVLQATLLVTPVWHCIELGLDTIAGTATLRINGVARDTAGGDFSTLATRRLRLGVPLKAYAATGCVHLDEWVIADTPIGPVVVEPTSDHADDPTRWLVVFNRDDADSAAFAEAYRAARGVPYANLLGLPLPTGETTDSTGHAALRDAIALYLEDTGLAQQIMGVLLCPGVPGIIDDGDPMVAASTAALLHSDDAHAFPVTNPHFATGVRPTAAALAGVRLTARIDAPTPALALALLERATNLSATGLGGGDDAALWLDPTPPGVPVDHPAALHMSAWRETPDAAATRLPMQWTEAGSALAAVQNDGFIWGWDGGDAPADLFGTPAGRRVVSVRLPHTPGPAPLLRDPGATHVHAAALAAGYAALGLSTRVGSPSHTPRVGPFFDALRRGWTLAEAWLAALPVLRDGPFLAGDPLLTVATPRAGWDVHGPVATLEHINPDAPALRLREADRSLALEAPMYPDPQVPERYVLIHRDALGRADGSACAVSTGSSAVPPVWPDVEGWPLAGVDGRLVARAWWDRPLRACGVERVELWATVEAAAAQLVATVGFAPHALHLAAEVEVPTQPTRFRWRTVGGGFEFDGPWSGPVLPPGVPNVALATLRVKP